MQGYETIFILDPNTTEEAQKELLAQCKEAVEGNGGALVRQSLWGRRRLAYRVKKREYGIYHLLYLDQTPAAITGLERLFKFNEDVLKWQTVGVEDLDHEFAKFESLKDAGSAAQSLGDR